MAVQIHPDAYKAIGVNSRGTDYPFVTPSEDIQYLLADFWLSHRVTTAVMPLRIAWVYGLDKAFDNTSDFGNSSSGSAYGSSYSGSVDTIAPTHSVDVIVVDANDDIVFDSTLCDDFYTADYDERLRIHEWRSADAACKMIQHAAFPSADDVWDVPTTIEPEDGTLDPLCSQIVPPNAEGLIVGLDTLRGDIILRNGYNTLLEDGGVVQSGLRRVQKVVLSATPGSGMGRFPECDEENIYIRRINTVPGSARGDFTLSAEGCYWLRRTGTYEDGAFTPDAATIQFGNDCGPCCECDDYVNTYTALVRLHTRFKDLANQLEDTRDVYHENRTRWLAQKACREAHPTKVSIAPFDQRYAEVGVSVCNNTAECLHGVKLYLIFGPQQCPGDTSYERILRVVPCSSFKSAEDGTLLPWEFGNLGAGNKITSALVAKWDGINPGTSAKLRFRLELLSNQSGEDLPASIQNCQFSLLAQPTRNGKVYGEAIQKYFVLSEC